MAQIIEPPGQSGFARPQPRLARLSALPGAGGEAQNLDLDAAALKRARQNIGTGGRDRNGPPAHGTGIVDQQRDDRVAEIGVLLALEGQGLLRINDDARQARGIKLPLLQIKFPRAVLLRHQAALQAVGEPCHNALQMRQLLVEIGAQAGQLLGIAEVFGQNDLVKFGREDFVVGDVALVLHGNRRTRRLGAVIPLGIVHVFRHFTRRTVGRVLHAVFHLVGRLVRPLHLLAFGACVLGAFAVLAVLIVVGGIVLIVVLAVIGIKR